MSTKRRSNRYLANSRPKIYSTGRLRRATGRSVKRTAPHPPRGFLKPLAMQTHNFCERTIEEKIELQTSNLNVDGHLNNTKTWTFQMSDIPQIASYQKLFEYYKINKVVVTFAYKTAGQYANTDPSIGRTINECNPTLIFKVDHNDVIADTYPTLMQSMRTKKKQLSNDKPNFSITLKPAIQSMLYSTPTATGYSPKYNTWIRMGDPAIPHYGLKFQITVPDSSGNVDYGCILVTQKIYFSAKNNE